MMATPKPVDFCGSAHRHMADAELLENNGRVPNAGHLYGYVAECGLKALLIWHGYPTDTEGSPKSQQTPNIRVHINELSAPPTFLRLSLFLDGRSGAKYLALIPGIKDFADWHIKHRYYSEAALPKSLPKWKTAARQVCLMLDHAKVNGLR